MKVYQFTWLVAYGAGGALIAARSPQQAKSIAKRELPSDGYTWRYDGLFKGLWYDDQEKPDVIFYHSYLE